MASPITHIVLAFKILSSLPSTIDKRAFIVGTSFPDIRYMAKLSREETHIEPVCWDDVVHEPSSFRAGMLFHNLVDILRIKHFEPYFYDRYNLEKYTNTYIAYYPLVMKMAEDTIFYSAVTDWPAISNYFDTVYPEELALCADKSIIVKWHGLLKNYCLQPPNLLSINQFLSGVGGLQLNTAPEDFNSGSYFVDLTTSSIFQQKIGDFYQNFETLVQEYVYSSYN